MAYVAVRVLDDTYNKYQRAAGRADARHVSRGAAGHLPASRHR